MSFTEADKRRLEALKQKEKEARAEARNEKKRDDRTCKKLFGMTAAEVSKKLSTPTQIPEKYLTMEKQINRLMSALPHRPESFEEYVQYYEHKHADNLR